MQLTKHKIPMLTWTCGACGTALHRGLEAPAHLKRCPECGFDYTKPLPPLTAQQLEAVMAGQATAAAFREAYMRWKARPPFLRFAIFEYADYYPAGGWEDFHSAYEEPELAITAAKGLATSTSIYGVPAPVCFAFDNIQVVDLVRREVIYTAPAVREERVRLVDEILGLELEEAAHE